MTLRIIKFHNYIKRMTRFNQLMKNKNKTPIHFQRIRQQDHKNVPFPHKKFIKFPKTKRKVVNKEKANLLVIMPNHQSGSKRYENPPTPKTSTPNPFLKTKNPFQKTRKEVFFYQL